MEQYIYWNNVFEYAKSKGLLNPAYTIDYTVGTDNYSLDVNQITKNGTVYGFVEMNNTEQTDIISHLQTELSIFESLYNNYSVDMLKTEIELQTFLENNNREIISIIWNRACSMYIVTTKA